MLIYDHEIVVRGYHARCLDELVRKTQIFKTYIDVFIAAAIIGLIENRKSPLSKRPGSEDDNPRKIDGEALRGRSELIDALYKSIILNSFSDETNVKDKAVELLKESSPNPTDKTLFESYVGGGLEYLYEKLILETSENNLTLSIVDLLVKYYQSQCSVSQKDLVNLSTPA